MFLCLLLVSAVLGQESVVSAKIVGITDGEGSALVGLTRREISTIWIAI
jgi:hypothetical protein